MSNYFKTINEVEYHKRPEASSSSLRTLYTQSPAHALYNLQNPKDSSAFLLGRAFHCAVLEPNEFANRYAIEPRKFDKRYKDDKAEALAFAQQNSDKQILSCADGDTIKAMAASAHQNHMHGTFFEEGVAEMSGFFEDPISKVRCRIRPDFVLTKADIMIDVKSVQSASPEAFTRDVRRYRYDMQAEFYSRGYRQITNKRGDFIFFCVEKNPPYSCAAYELDAVAYEKAERDVDAALAIWSNCVETGQWPSYSTDVMMISPYL